MNILQILNFHGINIPDNLWNYTIYNTSQLDESFQIVIRIWFTENESKRYVISFDMDSGNGYLRSSVKEEEIFEKKESFQEIFDRVASQLASISLSVL